MSIADVKEVISRSTDICVDGENYRLLVGYDKAFVAFSWLRDNRNPLTGFTYEEIAEKLSIDPDSVHFYKRVEVKPKKSKGGKGGREK